MRRIVIEQLRFEENEVNLAASFVDDVGADSLDVVELVMTFEEHFSIEISDAVRERMMTVGRRSTTP